MSRLAIEKRLERSLNRSKSRKRDMSVGKKTGLTHTYYMKSLKYYLGLKNKPPIGKAYCEHFLQSIAAIKYTQKLRPVSDEAIYKSQVNCPIIDEKHRGSKNELSRKKDNTVRPWRDINSHLPENRRSRSDCTCEEEKRTIRHSTILLHSLEYFSDHTWWIPCKN